MYEVYSTNGCTSCVAAKNLLESKDIPFSSKNIDDDLDALEFIVSQRIRQMPAVFKDGTFVGGFNELKNSLT